MNRRKKFDWALLEINLAFGIVVTLELLFLLHQIGML